MANRSVSQSSHSTSQQTSHLTSLSVIQSPNQQVVTQRSVIQVASLWTTSWRSIRSACQPARTNPFSFSPPCPPMFPTLTHKPTCQGWRGWFVRIRFSIPLRPGYLQVLISRPNKGRIELPSVGDSGVFRVCVCIVELNVCVCTYMHSYLLGCWEIRINIMIIIS